MLMNIEYIFDGGLFEEDESEGEVKGEYFQIYGLPLFNGFFFEVVQRKGGYQGYGARNAPIRLAAQLRHPGRPFR